MRRYPSTTRPDFMEGLRTSSIWKVSFYFIAVYLVITFGFAGLYRLNPALMPVEPESGIAHVDALNSFYNTVILGGMTTKRQSGDTAPKLLETVHGLIVILLFLSAIPVIFLKALYPRDTLILSSKLLFDPKGCKFSFRIINVNITRFSHPEIRVMMSFHTGNESYRYRLIEKSDDLPTIGNQDIVFSFFDQNCQIYENVQIARTFNKTKSDPGEKSHFRIMISIKGHYGFSPYAYSFNYAEGDIKDGAGFETIKYPGAFVLKKGKFRAIPDFWERFHRVIP